MIRSVACAILDRKRGSNRKKRRLDCVLEEILVSDPGACYPARSYMMTAFEGTCYHRERLLSNISKPRVAQKQLTQYHLFPVALARIVIGRQSLVHHTCSNCRTLMYCRSEVEEPVSNAFGGRKRGAGEEIGGKYL